MDRSGIGRRATPAEHEETHRGHRLRFAGFELDSVRLQLTRAGHAVVIDPKPLSLLEYLIANRERAVSRRELLETVWPGVVVGDDALSSAIRHARRAIGDGGSAQRLIRTIRGVGFRFVGEVEEFEATPNDAGFVGRGGILVQIDAALRAARAGSGRCVWLAGDPGMGKSRLLLEIEHRARSAGIPCHFGRCLEEAGAAPYRPWQQIVRDLTRGLGNGGVKQRFGPFAAEALRLLPENDPRDNRPTPPSEDGRAERLRLFDSLVELIRAAAEETPRLLAIDDLHRADDSTLELLLHLLRELPRMPVLLVGAYRDREIAPASPLAHALGETLPGVEHAELAGLAPSEVEAYTRALLGRQLSPKLARDLCERTGGNPLFVGEIVRGLDASQAAADGLTSTLPRGVRHAIRARIAALPPHAASILEAAAVIGREFDLDVLREVRGGEALEAEPAIAAALARGMLESAGGRPDRLRFSHILVRDVLYDAVPVLRRTELHAAVGHAIERLRPDPSPEFVALLAHHFGQAAGRGEAERAVRYAREAGTNAMEQAAFQEASAHFELALQALEFYSPADPREGGDEIPLRRVELLVKTGQARWRSGDTESARKAFLEAASLAEGVSAPDLLALAAVGYAGRTDAEPGVNEIAVSLLESALDALPGTDSVLRSEVLARLGTELYYRSDPARCDQLTDAALQMAERLDDRDALAYALSARTYSLYRPGVRLQRRLELCNRTIALAQEVSDQRALGVQQKALCLMENGDEVLLDECLLEFERTSERLRQPFFRWMASSFRGTRAFTAGRIDEAERLAHETLAMGQEVGTGNAFPMFALKLLYLRREQGRMGELEPALRELLEESATYSGFRAGLPPIYVQMGRLRDARDSFEQVMARDLDDHPRDQHWTPILAMLTPACASLHDEARARTLYALLRGEEGKMVIPGHGAVCDGSVSHHLARLATTFGDFDAADEHFDAAVTLERRAGARLFCAHSQRHWAGLLWKLGAPHEREKARALAEDARETYLDLGLEEGARQAENATRS